MNHPVINVEAALTNLGGDTALLYELAEMMLQDLDYYRNVLQDAVKQHNLTAIYEQAHSLKGAVSNFVAEPLRLAALELELAGKHQDIEQVKLCLPIVLSALDHFGEELKILVSKNNNQ